MGSRVSIPASTSAPVPVFTVFTPTYNRAHTIGRVYDSLRAQTFRHFEWLVIDDGSSDGTAALVEGWSRTADFPIRYIRQPHAGKHVAHNRALRAARGEFFLVFDSDDACVPTALERMLHHWHAIPADRREAFSGVAGLCRDQAGRIVGDRFPSEPLDASLRELRYVYRLRGEKWGPERTDILRRFPFPELANTDFMPEGAVWLAVAKSHKIRCVNEVFRIYHVDDAATGATLSRRRSLGENAPGRLYYYTWLLNNDLEYFFRSPIPFLKAALMQPVMALCAAQPLHTALASLRGVPAKTLVVLALPFSLALYGWDKGRTLCRRRHVAG
jgi:glycosyltransferase involved in cell wall biosynthesis